MGNNQVGQLAKKYGYLEYMIERYLALFGSETEAFLEGNEKTLLKTIRCNELVTTPDELEKRLAKKGFDLELFPRLPYAFQVRGSQLSPGATTEYLLGQYMLQSPASIWAVEALKPEGLDLVVDLCAAPGGKTTLIAQLMKNQGALLATDISRSRIRALRSNISRMHVKNTLLMRMDAAKLPDMRILADAVLLDAPCTGEGLIPLDPTRKRSRTLQDIMTLAKVQRRLITAAAELLREGGVLVYSTCSFAPEENEEIIDYAIHHCPLRIINTGLRIGDPGFTRTFGKSFDKSLDLARRLYPHKHNTEGYFICKLEKVEA
ncbi:MAG: NOL1/NOP2/sun family putative RNA methylase [Promethearchaeota archaeon]